MAGPMQYQRDGPATFRGPSRTSSKIMDSSHPYRRALAALLLLLAAACSSPSEPEPDVPGDPGGDGGTSQPSYRAWVR